MKTNKKGELIFESFQDFAKHLLEGKEVTAEPTKVEQETEDEYEDIPRLDKEAFILGKTDKTEDELYDLSDDEIDAMFKNLKDN